MITGRAIAKYVAVIAITCSAGGVLAYEVHQLKPNDRVRLNVQVGKFDSALGSRLAVWFKPIDEVFN